MVRSDVSHPVRLSVVRLLDGEDRCQLGKLIKRSFEFVGDLGGEHPRCGQRAAVVEGLVAQPGDVEVSSCRARSAPRR